MQTRERLGAQLTAAIASALFPYLVRYSGTQTAEGLSLLDQTFIFSLIASIISVGVIRALPKYPGTESSSSILSTVSFVFGLLMAILLLGRIGYARGVIIGAYSLCVILLYAVNTVLPGRPKFVIAILGETEFGAITRSDVDCIRITDASAPVSNVHAVAIDLKTDLPSHWERRICELALEGVPVYHIKHLRESLTGQVEMEHIAETSYGTLSPPIAYVATKRIIDVGAAGVLIAALWPFLILTALLIRLDSPGPAIFRQVRTGFRGKPFVLMKFRTMRATAGVGIEAAQTQADDARITRVGKILRRTRLDELPQLWNIVKGEMSLIGPRPEVTILADWYERQIPFYRYRHIVLPGVTGWAQVNQGHVTAIGDVSVKLNYDFYYIKHLSPWLDLLIVFKTIGTVCTGSGAK